MGAVAAVVGRMADAFHDVADWRDTEYRTKTEKRNSLAGQLAGKQERHAVLVDDVGTLETRLRDLRTKALLGEASDSDVRAAEKALAKTQQDLTASQDALTALEDSIALLDDRLPGLEDEARRRNTQEVTMPRFEAQLATVVAAAKVFAEANTALHSLVREVVGEYPEDIYGGPGRYRPVNIFLSEGSPRFINAAWVEFLVTGEPDAERTPFERWLAAIRRAGHKV